MVVPWEFYSFILSKGAGTALIGKEAAMACTVAVEDVIGDHYNRSVETGLLMKPATTVSVFLLPMLNQRL